MIRTERQIPRARRQTDLGAGLIVSPGQIADEAAVVNSDVQRIDAVAASADVPAAVLSEWAQFKTLWDGFYESHDSFWSAGNWWGGSYDQVLDYKDRVKNWAAVFARYGAGVAGPSVESPSDRTKSPWSALTDAIPWVIGGVVAVALLPSIINAFSKRRSP